MATATPSSSFLGKEATAETETSRFWLKSPLLISKMIFSLREPVGIFSILSRSYLYLLELLIAPFLPFYFPFKGKCQKIENVYNGHKSVDQKILQVPVPEHVFSRF